MDKYVKSETNCKLNSSSEWLSVKVKPKSKSLSKLSVPIKLNPKKKHKIIKTEINLQKKMTYSPVISEDCKKVVESLCASSFKQEYEKHSLKYFDKNKICSDLKSKGGILRNSEARLKFMHGYECRCCAPYYDALNLTEEERRNRVNQISRHRAFEPIPSTPDRYWDVKFSDMDKQNKFGLIIKAESPLFKSIKKINAKRKLF